MSTHRADAPSAFKLEKAMSALMETRERLLREYPEIAEDETLLTDMIEGEGGDAMDVLDRVVRASIEADSLAKAAKERKAEIGERQTRFERRRDHLRALAFSALEALDIKKLERPDFTASIRAGQASVVVFDEEALLPAFWRYSQEPDKAKIRDAISKGFDVDGATLSNAAPSLAVRVK
jgi:Gp157 protein